MMKLIKAANLFQIIQVGLCLFKKLDNNTYEATAYNVYVFPQEYKSYCPQITMEVSAVNFNTKNGMNWQKWIAEGVPFIPLKEAKKLERDLKGNTKTSNDEPIVIQGEKLKKKVETTMKSIDHWLAHSTIEEFEIKEPNRFLRRYYYLTLEQKYSNLVIEKREFDTISIKKGTYSDKKASEEKKESEQAETFKKKKGFTRVFELITASKKPLVGHNCFIDMLFFLRQFYDTLPNDYEVFKKKIRKYLPLYHYPLLRVYDTKYIAKLDYFKDIFSENSMTRLEDLQEVFENEPSFDNPCIKLAPFCEKYERSDTLYHEAGYDAFVTGTVFLKMAQKLSIEDLAETKNRINIYKCMYAIRLDGNDEMDFKGLIFWTNLKKSDPFWNEKEEVMEKLGLTDKVSFRYVAQKDKGIQDLLIVLDEENMFLKKQFMKFLQLMQDQYIEVQNYNNFVMKKLEKELLINA